MLTAMQIDIDPFWTVLYTAITDTIIALSSGWHLVMLFINAAIEETAVVCQHQDFPFIALFIFRYLRTMVNLWSFWAWYESTPLPEKPSYTSKDCTVILPTIDPGNRDFLECINSCILNRPKHILIVTVGYDRVHSCRNLAEQYQLRFPSVQFTVIESPIANKRLQVVQALPYVKTRIIVLLDDHVFWPSMTFLQTAIAPFEDKNVGGVGTNKRVRKTETGFNMRSFWNMIGALYLERHNFEIRASNAIDGGVFVISGRTALYRTSILKDPDFIQGFTDEKYFFGKSGPLKSGDDNFITRWLVNHGYDIKIQYCDDAVIETTVGEYPKFLSQCVRWARTTWRSNSASLFTERTVWYRQPWSVYAVYLTSFVNFALFNDVALVYFLKLSSFYSSDALHTLYGWIFFTKMIKIFAYFLRHPEDILMLPGYIVFAYYHSFIKLYSFLTLFNDEWGGRDLNAINSNTNQNRPHSFPSNNDGSTDDPYTECTSATISSGETGRMFGAMNNRFGSASTLSSIRAARTTGFPTLLTPGTKSTTRQTRPKLPYNTPWGPVSPSEPHQKPANLLQHQFNPSCVPRQEISSDRHGTSDDIFPPIPPRVAVQPTVPYPDTCDHDADTSSTSSEPTWARGPQCKNLHSDNGKFDKQGTCLVDEVFDLPYNVIAGRPRM